jgi:hypothetical protein
MRRRGDRSDILLSAGWSALFVTEGNWIDVEQQIINEPQSRYSVSYTAYVDLSAKIEQWTKDSAVAVSNGESKVYLVTARVKQKLRLQLAARYDAKTLKYRILALLVYLAIRDDLANIKQVVLDQDYTGNAAETTVRNILLSLLQRQNPSITPAFVRFQRVRGSSADKMARDVYMRQKPPTRKIGFAELENILKGNR